MDTLKNLSFSLILLLVGSAFTLIGLSGDASIGDYKLPIQEGWARGVSTTLGLLLLALAFYLEIKSKPGGNSAAAKKSGSTTIRDLRDHYDKFTKINEWEFLDKVDLSKVSHLDILGHTGQSIYIPFRERLEKLIEKGPGNYPEEIRILIRAPIAEGLKRNHYVHNTAIAVGELHAKNKNIDVRYYESVPAIRGIICQYRTENKARDIYITSYYWPKPNKSKAFDFAYITKDVKDARRSETSVLESWIDHYWGKDEIHTVVFDFDDTLAETRDIQIKAWAQVIVQSLEKGNIKIENLSNRFKNWISQKSVKSPTDPVLLDTIRKVFIEKQLAEAIAHEIFVDVDDEKLRQINKNRFEIRVGMMDKCELYEGVEKMLEKLSSRYNLAIISSTDEQLISNFLAKKNIAGYFPVILGKRDPRLQFEREKIHHKASLLIKLSEIIGMPLSRLVYVGDNNSDYLATRQLGIAFIEARQAAKLAKKETIITDIDPKAPPIGQFDSYENDELLEILRKHSQNITRNKYQI